MAVLALLLSTALKANNVPDVFAVLPGRQTMAVMVCRCGKELPLAPGLLVDTEIPSIYWVIEHHEILICLSLIFLSIFLAP